MDLWIQESDTQFSECEKNWEEAIRTAAGPLIEKKKITESYIEAMISNVKELGDYIILVPKVAMPHARPEKGALDTGVSFLVLKKPVLFSNNKEVSLIICLSATNNEEHLLVLQQISALIDDDEKVDRLLTCSNSKEFVKLANEIISEEE